MFFELALLLFKKNVIARKKISVRFWVLDKTFELKDFFPLYMCI